MKRLISLVISIALLAVLFSLVDIRKLSADLKGMRWDWFLAAMLMFIPQILTIAWRWKKLANVFAPLSLGKSVSMVLASNTLNLIFPSKLGDLSKGYFLAKDEPGRRESVPLQTAMSIVVFEKMLDVGSLSAIMLAGTLAYLFALKGTAVSASLLLLPMLIGAGLTLAVLGIYFIPINKLPYYSKMEKFLKKTTRLKKVAGLILNGHDTVQQLQERGGNRAEILCLSLLIWVFHLSQIAMFFYALQIYPPLSMLLSLVSLAIFIGLLPLTIAGFGTRDAALVALFSAYPSHTILAVSMLINLRYIIPAAAGIPFFHKYLNNILSLRQETKNVVES